MDRNVWNIRHLNYKKFDLWESQFKLMALYE